MLNSRFKRNSKVYNENLFALAQQNVTPFLNLCSQMRNENKRSCYRRLAIAFVL